MLFIFNFTKRQLYNIYFKKKVNIDAYQWQINIIRYRLELKSQTNAFQIFINMNVPI